MKTSNQFILLFATFMLIACKGDVQTETIELKQSSFEVFGVHEIEVKSDTKRVQVMEQEVARFEFGEVNAMLVGAPTLTGRQYIYVTGTTGAAGLATPGVYQEQINGGLVFPDVYVAKLDGSTLEVVWLTYLGGSESETGTGLAFGQDGSIVVAGNTTSDDFPTLNALQPESGGPRDVFIAILSGDGRELLYGSYFGGDGWDTLTSLERNGDHLYFAGSTDSESLDTSDNAFQPDLQSIASSTPAGRWSAGFLMRMSLDARTVEYLTYFGGAGPEFIYDIAVVSSTEVWIGGSSYSTNLPTTPDAFDRDAHACPNTDGSIGPEIDQRYCAAFLARLNTDSGALNYSTYFGGEGGAIILSLALAGPDILYVAGATPSPDFPLTRWAVRTQVVVPSGPNVSEDGFVIKFHTDGRFIEYSTFVGGDQGHDRINAMSVNGASAIVVGRTESNNFLAADPAGYGGDRDGFVLLMSPYGRRVQNAFYLGGGLNDEVRVIERMPLGTFLQPVVVPETFFLAGVTHSADFSGLNGNAGSPDVFIMRLEVQELPVLDP